MENIKDHLSDRRLRVVRGHVGHLDLLVKAMADHQVVIDLASNPDIARAATEPKIDFYQGTVLTNNVIEAMRRTGTRVASSTPPAAGFTGISASARRRKITSPCCRSRPTARANWPAKR